MIVGYLLAGTVVGPNVLGWISKQQEIYYIAELGVALLLFVIGLEFSPRRLLELGKTSLGTGILQIIITGAAGWAIARACGTGGQEALVIGMMIANPNGFALRPRFVTSTNSWTSLGWWRRPASFACALRIMTHVTWLMRRR